MRPFLSRLLLAALACLGIQASARAETDDAEPTPLAVGALQLASHPDLGVDQIDLTVDASRVVYTYVLKNKGKAEIALAAAVALPDLQASADGNETYALPSQKPENPVDLSLSVNGTTEAPTIVMHAYALGIDWLDEIKARKLPLIPFGAPIDTAFAALAPEVLDALAAQGLASARDPAQPGDILADWSLQVTHRWTIRLPPGRSTRVSLAYAPVVATYKLDKDNLSALDDVKEETCLQTPALRSLRDKLRSKKATIPLTDILVANDAPTRWVASPDVSVTVNKPAASGLVVFCGMDAKSASETHATGKVPGAEIKEGFRILIFGTPTL